MEPLLTDDEARKAQEAQQGLDAASPQHDPVAAAAVDAIHQGRELLQVFGPAFARSRFFWKSALLAVVEGVVMGLLALVFFNGFEQGSKLWLTEDYDVRVANGDVGFGHGGKAWWPLLTTAAGLVVGLISLVPWYPKHVHGLFAEVRDLYANPWAAPWAVLVSCISLAAGASVGPEAAMGMLGAALGTALGAVLGEMPERRVHTSALTGMAGGMGALFPTPLLAVLLLHELGATARADEAWWIAAEEVAHGGASSLNGDSADAASEFSGAIGASGGSEHFMETIVLMGVAACSSWTVFYALKDRTFLESSTVKLAGYDAHAYKTWHMGAAIVLGFIGGVMGILGAIFMGIFKKVFTGVKARLKQRRWRVLAAVVPPMIGGAIYGAIAVALPLTLGDGASQLPNAIAQGGCVKLPSTSHRSAGNATAATDDDSTMDSYGGWFLVWTAAAKMLTLAVSQGSGFVGGQIFPLMFAGACAGTALTRAIPQWPCALTVPALMSAVPAAFAPVPFTLVGIVESVFVLGGQMSAPAFVATFIAFLMNCGLGVIQRMVARNIERAHAAASQRGIPH